MYFIYSILSSCPTSFPQARHTKQCTAGAFTFLNSEQYINSEQSSTYPYYTSHPYQSQHRVPLPNRHFFSQQLPSRPLIHFTAWRRQIWLSRSRVKERQDTNITAWSYLQKHKYFLLHTFELYLPILQPINSFFKPVALLSRI